MNFDKEMQSAIMAIYDATLNPDLWTKALDHIVKIAGARSASLLVNDNFQDVALSPYQLSGLSSVFLPLLGKIAEVYLRDLAPYEHEDSQYLKKQPKLVFVRDHEIWTDEEALRQRPDYRFLEEQAGIRRRAIVRLNDNRAWFDCLALQYEAKLNHVPDESLVRASILLPHLAKAIELNRSLSILKMRYNAILSMIDHIQIGVCIALPTGEIISSNLEAKRIFDNRDGLSLGLNNQLMTRHSNTSLAIQKAIQKAGDTARGKGHSQETLISIPKRTPGQSYLIEIIPLRDSLGEIERGLAGAVINLIDPDNPKPFALKNFIKLYHLTQAEGHVCRYIFDGATNAQIAEIRQVSSETIKSQISSILNKAGCRRRSDLFRLILRITPPINAI